MQGFQGLNRAQWTLILNLAFKQVTICLLQLCQINLSPRPSLSAMVLVVQNASALILLRFASAFCHLFECRVNNAKSSLFAPFYASSKAASWSTSPSMSYEAALKSAKKYIKNQNF